MENGAAPEKMVNCNKLSHLQICTPFLLLLFIVVTIRIRVSEFDVFLKYWTNTFFVLILLFMKSFQFNVFFSPDLLNDEQIFLVIFDGAIIIMA